MQLIKKQSLRCKCSSLSLSLSLVILGLLIELIRTVLTEHD